MLKLKLTKDEFEKLSDDFKKEYKKEGKEGSILDTDVEFEDTTSLKNALKQEKEHRKEATTKVTQLEEKVSDLEARAGKPSDIEKSWEKKLTAKENEFKGQLDGLKGQLRTILVDNVATQLAAEISISPELVLPHIKSRLTIEESDGKHITRVLDSEGKASAMSVNELKSEFLANEKFAPIIRASSASGGGASGSGKGGSGGAKKFSEMSESEKVTLYRTDKAGYDRAKAADPAMQQQAQVP